MRVVLIAVLVLVAAVAKEASALGSRDQNLLKMYKAMPRAQLAAELRGFLSPIFRTAIDDNIKAILEELKKNMTAPMPALGLPTLDPLEIEHFDINLKENIVSVTGTVDNVKVDNLSTFVVDNIKANLLLLRVDFAITLPQLLVKGEYDIDGIISGMIPVYGKGLFDVEVTKFNVSGQIKIGSNDGFVYIKDLPLNFDIEALHLNFEGLLGGGDLSDVVNEVINDVVPKLIADNKAALITQVQGLIMTTVNNKLEGVTIEDILDMINGGKGKKVV